MNNTKEFLCESANSKKVYFDNEGSHASTHFADTPPLRGLVIEVLSSLDLEGEEVKTHFDLGRVVGTSDVVRVDDNDEIVYGQRRNREEDGLVPFVKNRDGDPCQTVAMHVTHSEDGTYDLSSAWIGTFGGDDEPFPNSPDATERSVGYWNSHAFVYGSQEIVAGTETPAKPW